MGKPQELQDSTFHKPYVAGKTLFLDPKAPKEVWATYVKKLNFLEVYIEVTPGAPDQVVLSQLTFAEDVHKTVRQHRELIDPVVIGPVDARFMRKFESRVNEIGLRIAGSFPKDYQKEMERARRRLGRARIKSS